MPKQTTFKVGDIVRLKSGGPDMTVQSEHESSTTRTITYRCQWFAGKKLESGSFPPESLEHKKPETK
jgi:uncharacterized protein YodC (DUF2158 family)